MYVYNLFEYDRNSPITIDRVWREGGKENRRIFITLQRALIDSSLFAYSWSNLKLD